MPEIKPNNLERFPNQSPEQAGDAFYQNAKPEDAGVGFRHPQEAEVRSDQVDQALKLKREAKREGMIENEPVTENPLAQELTQARDAQHATEILNKYLQTSVGAKPIKGELRGGNFGAAIEGLGGWQENKGSKEDLERAA